LVAAAVLAVYGWWLAAAFVHGHDARDFIQIGKNYLALSHASSVITLDPHFHYPADNVGYDGQFNYYIAIDPAHARYYVGDPGYRYGRILYPMAARLLALGRADLTPYTLILVNWLALAGGTLALASWLARKHLSPWFALVFGLYPGLFVGLHRDLTEPLAYALVALAVYNFDFGGRRRVPWAGLCFALAVLTRESAAIFPVAYGLALLCRGWRGASWRPAGLFLGLALGPIVLYKGFLLLWLGSFGGRKTAAPEHFPLRGLLSFWPLPPEQINVLFTVVLPGFVVGTLAVWSLRRRWWRPEFWALLVNILVFIVALNRSSYVEYQAAGRIATGVVLAALLCLPRFQRLSGSAVSWLWVSTVLWFLPWYSLLSYAVGGS
jgi:hypothetical protein